MYMYGVCMVHIVCIICVCGVCSVCVCVCVYRFMCVSPCLWYVFTCISARSKLNFVAF